MRSDDFLLLAMAAQRFGCRPSAMAVIRDPVLALDFDLAGAARLMIFERGAPANNEAAAASELYW